jgi:ribonuclease J
MNIKIHRTSDSASETLIEISTAKTNILFDLGANLDGSAVPSAFDSFDFTKFNAVFLSHAHTDYVGLANKTVYLSELTSRIISATYVYNMEKAPAFSGFYQDKVSISVGDITVTPILADSETFDSYLFLIKGEGKSILYSGDYHANGRTSFEEILKNLPAKVDTLLCEGMGLTRADVNSITERDLEEKATEILDKKTGPVFAMLSSTDIDRISTLFRAAKRCGRSFLEDLYMANITDAIGNIVPNPNGSVGVKAFLTAGYQPEHVRYQMFRNLNRIDKNKISSEKFVMCVRPNMKKYLKSLSQTTRFYGGMLILSFAAGEEPDAEDFIHFAQSKGLEIVTLRTSGHADARALQALVSTVHPTKILLVRDENASWFAGEFHGTPVIKEDHMSL